MNKKIISFFIAFVLFFITGGIFLFSGADMLERNSFLASIFNSKDVVVLSKNDLASLRDRIIFLEEELENKNFELEFLDDLTEKNDLLNQEIMELNYEIQILQQAIFEYENNEKEAEEGGEEEESELEEESADNAEEKKSVCQLNEININTASFEDMQKIVGIGPAYAQKIISARPFCSLDDLLKVSGIGEKTLKKIKEQGCAYVAAGLCSGYIFASSGGGGSGGGTSLSPSPEINLSFPSENPVNKEIEVGLSVSGIKSGNYDIKISIEKDEVLSDIYNEKEQNWQNSYNYLKEFFSGDSFSGKFKLKIKESKKDFRGEADVLVRIRESGKSSYIGHSAKIQIAEAIAEYKLIINIIGEGNTTPASGSYVYKEGEEIVITASPNDGWKFIGWTGDVASEENEITLIMDQDKVITASFEEENSGGDDPPLPEQNLLLNEFFDDGWEGTEASGNPINWVWGKRGGLNLESSPLIDGKKSFYHEPYSSTYYLKQIGKKLEVDKIYYAEAWVKGTGKVKVGIEVADGAVKEPTSYVDLVDSGWTRIAYSYKVKPNEETANGGIAIKLVRYKTTGERLIIGAAWFGTTEPPKNWLL